MVFSLDSMLPLPELCPRQMQTNLETADESGISIDFAADNTSSEIPSPRSAHVGSHSVTRRCSRCQHVLYGRRTTRCVGILGLGWGFVFRRRGEMVRIPVKANADSVGKPNSVPE